MRWMNRLPWLRTSLETLAPALARRHAAAPPRRSVVLGLERLESREVFAAFTVNTLVDDANSHDVNPGDGVALDANGKTSLRAAMEESNALAGKDQILLPTAPGGATVVLTQGELSVTQDVEILPQSGAGTAEISGGGASRAFNVAPGAELTLENLTVLDGSAAGDGGAILAGGNVVLSNVQLLDNKASGNGGAVFVQNGGYLNAYQLTATGNSAGSLGGALAVDDGAEADVFASQITGNQALLGGGVATLGTGQILLNNTNLSGNDALYGDPYDQQYGSGIYEDDSANTLPIAGQVWYDLNANGQRDPGEPPAVGIPVYLIHDNAIVGSTVTDANGAYVFNALPLDPSTEQPLIYYVQFDPIGNLFTGQHVGPSGTDSDVNPANGLSGPIQIAVEQGFPKVDAGLIPTAPPNDGQTIGIPYNLPPLYLVPGTNNVNPLAAPFYIQPQDSPPFRSRGGDRLAAYLHVYKLEQVDGQTIVKRVLTMPLSTTDPTEIQGLIGTIPPGKYRITMEARLSELMVWEGMLPMGQLAVRQGIDRVLKALHSQSNSPEALRELLPTAGNTSEVAEAQKAARIRSWFEGPAAPSVPTEVHVVPEVPPRTTAKPAPPMGGEEVIPLE